MIFHKLIGRDRKGNNINLCGRQGAGTDVRSLITCNKCRAKMHMKKVEEPIMPNTKKITVDLTNVSREEQEQLRQYLENNCWAWKEETTKE
jgi:hypothetical protein